MRIHGKSAASGFFRSFADWIPRNPTDCGVLRLGFRRIQTFWEPPEPDSAVSGFFGRIFSWARPCPDFWGVFFSAHGRVQVFGKDFLSDTAVPRFLGRNFSRTRAWAGFLRGIFCRIRPCLDAGCSLKWFLWRSRPRLRVPAASRCQDRAFTGFARRDAARTRRRERPREPS